MNCGAHIRPYSSVPVPSGFFFGAKLLGITNLSAAQIVGTDLAFGLAIALVGTGVHMFGGHYAASILMKMAIGGVAGGIVSSGFAPKIPNRTLLLALSWWLTVIGLQVCWQAIK